jgi:trk system potassium uptake protein TrkH
MLLFLRPVLYLTGMMQLIVAGLMMIPCLLEILSGGPDADAFLESAMITGGVALALILSMKSEFRSLTVRQMFLLVVITWAITSLTCALPFIVGQIDLTFTDAFFEAVSGITTTGGTVIVGLNDLPGGILLWRSLLQWLGGIGIVGIAIVLFPFMRIGGMQLFKSESSEKGEKIFAQAKVFAASLIGIYLTISIISVILFHLAGMNWFDAINHMMTAVSTGGFSIKDSSLGYYASIPVLWAGIASMLLGALPFTWYMLLGVDTKRAWRDEQVRSFLIVTIVICLMMTAWVTGRGIFHGFEAFSHASFNVISVMTTTGFASTDYNQWGSFALTLFFTLYFIGGCTGSTTGSIKLFRWSIIIISLKQQMLRMMSPHRVTRLVYNGRPFSEEVRDAVANFIVLFFLAWIVASLLLGLTGLDLDTSISGALSAISNVGPGLGEIIGPAGSYAPLNDAAKWILSFAMLLGRLEILVVMLVFMRAFWKD